MCSILKLWEQVFNFSGGVVLSLLYFIILVNAFASEKWCFEIRAGTSYVKKVVWHHVIKIVQDNQYYITYTVLFSDRSCVLLKQMCWFWHDLAWNQLRLSLSNVQSWWNIPCLFFSSLDFFTDSIGISAKFMQVVFFNKCL